MKNLTKFVVMAALVALVVAVQPADAACGNAYLITAPGKTIRSNPVKCTESASVPGACFYTGPARVSGAFDASFWAQGNGDPIVGPGFDNGALTDDGFVNQYYAPAFQYYRIPQILDPTFNLVNWTQAGDGCIDAAADWPATCTCMGMFDQWDGVGYFALLSSSPESGNFDLSTFVPGDEILLKPIPAPTITTSQEAGTDVLLTVTVDTPAEGLYLDPACGPCASLSYQVCSTVGLARDTPSPADRSAASFPNCSATTPVGTSTQLTAACSGTDQTVWVATTLVVDSGYETTFLSGDTLQVNCGTNLADPIDFDIKPRPTSTKPGKGRIDSPRRR